MNFLRLILRKMMKNKEIYSIHFEEKIIYMKDIEMKIYRDFINFKSLYSSRELKIKKSLIIHIQRYEKREIK